MRFTYTRSSQKGTPLPASRIAFRRAKANREVLLVRWLFVASVLAASSWIVLLTGLDAAAAYWRGKPLGEILNGGWRALPHASDIPSLLGLLICAAGVTWVVPSVIRYKHERALLRATREGVFLQRQRKRHLDRATWWFNAIFIGVIVLAIAAQRSRLLGVLVVAGPIYFSSIMLLGQGLKARAGAFLTCARCGYRMTSWRRATDPCTECGNLWKQPWGAVIGAPVVRWDRVAWGVVLQLVSLPAIVWLVWGSR